MKNAEQEPLKDQNDQTVLIYDSDTFTSDCDDVISSIDEFVNTLTVGPFHYFIILACGLSYGGYAISNQAIGLILITACDLDININNKSWLGTNFMIGIIVGSSLLSKLTDSYGRRKVLLISIFIYILGTLASALAYNYAMLAVMMVLIGGSFGGIATSIHAYVLEFFPRNSRGTAGACLSTFPILGNVYGSVVALIILPRQFDLRLGLIHFTSWRIYLLITLIPALFSFGILLFMPNSLRFVLNRQDQKQVRNVLDKIDRINSYCRGNCYTKRQGYSIKLSDQVIFDRNIANSRYENKNSFISHFRKLMVPPWRKRLLILSITWLGYCISDQGFTIWVPTVMSYYVKGNKCRYHPHHIGNNFSMNSVHNVHANYSHCYSGDKLNSVIMDILIGSLLSIPIALLATLLINRIGRKVLYCIMASTCALCILLIGLIDTVLSTMILSSIFLSLTSNTWIPGKIWSTELFSTEIRGTAIGILNVIGHSGAILSSIVFSKLFKVNCTMTLLLFSVSGFLCCIITISLPDTTDIDIR